MRNIVMCLILAAFFQGAVLPVQSGGAADNNIVIVLDASGSMNNRMHSSDMTKLDAAKAALLEVLRQTPDNTDVGLLVFSASNLTNDWVVPLGPLDQDELERAVLSPRPGGKTPLGVYIKKGADALLKKREQQFGYGTYRLLIVTDGEAGDQKKVERYVPEVLSRGITMDVIGVDMKQDHTLATKVHTYRRADDPEALTKALVEVFAEIGETESDVTPDEAFAELAGIPDEMAGAMLKALATSGNNPIGEDSARKSSPESDTQVPKTQANSASKTNSEPPSKSPDYKVVIAVFFVLYIIIRKLKRRKRS